MPLPSPPGTRERANRFEITTTRIRTKAHLNAFFHGGQSPTRGNRKSTGLATLFGLVPAIFVQIHCAYSLKRDNGRLETRQAPDHGCQRRIRSIIPCLFLHNFSTSS